MDDAAIATRIPSNQGFIFEMRGFQLPDSGRRKATKNRP
jgi:hypothetical protein